MTKVEVFTQEGSIVRVLCEGHTGYAEEGEDIVCASLSSVVQTAVLGLMQVLGINVRLKRNDIMGLLEFSLPPLSDQLRRDADLILSTMLCGITDLHEGYSDFIELEVK